MGKNNSLPPASQPWVRELEARLKALESGVSRVKRSPASAPTRHIDTDNLRVQSLTVGGSDPVVEVLQTGVADMGWSKVVGADRVTFTMPVPVIDREPSFVLEWSIVASASKDYIQFHSSLHDDPYTPPTDPSGSLAGEEAEYFAVYSYVNDDPTDELYKPIPTSVTVTFIDPNGGPVDVTMVESTLKLITPGSGGLQIGSDGGISIVDGVGNETTIREISPEEAQGIKDSTEWINTSGEELRDGVSDAQGKLTNLISNVLPQLNADLEANKDQISETKSNLEVAFPSGNYFDVETALTDAQLAANGKNVNTYSDVAESTLPENVPNPPSPANRINGDRHRVRTNTTYRILAEWELTNGAWVKVKYGGATLTDLDAGTITSGYVSTTVLKAQDVAAHVGSFISVSAEQVTAGKFKSDRLDTNEIWTNDLAARVGTFSRVVVASASNYRDPGLTDPQGFDTALTYLTRDPVGGYRGGGAFIIAGSSSLRAVYEVYNASKPLSRVEGGKNLSVGVWIKSTAAIAPGTVGLATQFRTETGNTGSVVYTHIDTSVPANTWTRLTVGLVAPANATRIQLALRSLAAHTGTVTYSDIELLPQVSGTLIEPGGIKTNHLGVVPESGAGGLELLPPGLRILPPDNGEAGTTISLRNDEPAAISFSQGGEATFSVSPEGDLTAKNIYADLELYYKAHKLSDILEALPRGIVTYVKMSQAAIVGTGDARLTSASVDSPPTPRSYKITFGFHRQSTERMQISFRQSTGLTVSSNNSVQNYWYVAKTAQATADYVEVVHIIPNTMVSWGGNNTITFGFFARSLVAGNTITFDPNHGVTMVVEDIGPAVDVIDSSPFVPPSSGGTSQGSDTGTTKKIYTKSWTTTGHRTYSYTGLMSTRASQSVVQGYMAGANSRGHWFFNDADIRSNLSGAELVSGTLTITNQHSYSNSGMTAVVRSHGYSTAPSTFGSSNPWTSVHVPKGGSVTLPLTASLMSALASGSVRGFSLDHGGGTSTANYGYFSPTATLRLTYKK